MSLKFLSNQTTDNKIGIGTNVPGAKLEIKDGDLWLNGATSTYNPEIFFIDDAGPTGIAGAKIRYENNNGNLYFDHKWDTTTSGFFFRNRVDGTPLNTMSLVNGNVGIGTTTFNNYWSGYAVLKLGADNGFFSNIASGTGSALFIAQNVYNDGNIYRHVRSNESGLVDMRDGKFSFLTSPSGSAGAAATMTNRFTILEGGNVGIGTTNPVSHVAARKTLIISDATDGANIEIWGNSGGKSILQSVNTDTYVGNLAGAGTTYILSGAGATAITALSGGNVGIGTITPGAKLEINDTNKAINTKGNLFVSTTDTLAVDKGGQISLGGVWSGTSQIQFAGIAGRKENATSGNAGGYLQFSTTVSSGGNLTEKMRIASDGKTTITANNGTIMHLKSLGSLANSKELLFQSGGDRVIIDAKEGASPFGVTDLSFELGSIEKMRLIETGQLKLNAYNSTNLTGTPTYLLGTDASGNVVKTNTVPGSGAGPYLPLAGGTMTGTGSIEMPDNFSLLLGGGIFKIFNDGTYSIIRSANEPLLIDSNGITFRGYAPYDTLATITSSGISIKSALLSNQENTDVDTGTETIAEVSSSSFTAAFFDFVIKKTTNVRSGTVYACHDGTNVEFTETSTNDLGDTSDVTLSVDISGGNMRLRATTTSDDWSIKSLIRAI